ncbi:MAG: hypothetical protein AAF194_08380, partial [Pseudomonadota bacterium]
MTDKNTKVFSVQNRQASMGYTSRLAKCAIQGVALLAVVFPAHALVEYSKAQKETVQELLEQLEQRHYSKLKYDDDLSSAHLDNYLDSLDGGRMFLTQEHVDRFEQFRFTMDEDLAEGRLDTGFELFNLYHQRLIDRLEWVVASLPDELEEMDFSKEESMDLDADDRPWAKDEATLDERWRLQLKNQALNLRLAKKSDDEIAPTLIKRYTNQLNRVNQYNAQDAFQIYA